MSAQLDRFVMSPIVRTETWMDISGWMNESPYSSIQYYPSMIHQSGPMTMDYIIF